MAEFTSRTITSTRREIMVPASQPWGADYGEVSKAAAAAWGEYREKVGLPNDAQMPADLLRFYPGDDQIVIVWTVEEKVT